MTTHRHAHPESAHVPDLGSVRLDPPDDILAGAWGTWRLTYTAGRQGIAPGGGLRIGTDTDSDWGIPQASDPTAAEYVTAQAPEGISPLVLAYRINQITVRLYGRCLAAGEQVTITLGDRSGGGPGSRAQTIYERSHFFTVAVDAQGDDGWQSLSDWPRVSVRGADAVALVLVAPSLVACGEPFRLLLRAQDAWGNPSSTYRGCVHLVLAGGTLPDDTVTFTPSSDGVVWLDGCMLYETGICRVAADDGQGLSTDSNPILCSPRSAGSRLFWGEPHGGQLHMAEKIAEFFRYAREVSGLDFCGYQANDERLSGREVAIQQSAEIEAHAPGRFVPLPGFEWSAVTANGGHHNVYFGRFGQPIRRSFHSDHIAHEADLDTDLTHTRALHDGYRGTDTIITPHVGGGRADLQWHDPTLEPAIEVTSNHGTFEWFLRDALERRYRVGFVGGSDGYTGRPGGEYPGYIERRFAKGASTALFADDLTLPSLFTALRHRRAYATTGARILISVMAAGAPIGSETSSRSAPTISGFVAGTAPLEAIEIHRGLDRIHSVPLGLGARKGVLRVLWGGAAHRDSYSAAIWDGVLTLGTADGHEPRIERAAQMLRFDSPRCWVRQEDEATLRWHALTSGYRSGFLVPLNVSGQGAFVDLAIDSSLATMSAFGGFGDEPPMRMSYTPMETLRYRLSLADLEQGPVTLSFGEVERGVTLSWAPASTQRDVHFSFTDTAPQPGTNPYWLRVIQQDQEIAWTSPIFVDWLAADTSQSVQLTRDDRPPRTSGRPGWLWHQGLLWVVSHQVVQKDVPFLQRCQ